MQDGTQTPPQDQRSTIAWTEAQTTDIDDNGTSDVISWTASEFIDHQKTKAWYVNLTVVVIVAAALTFLLTRDVITVIVLLVAGLALGFYAARPPRELTYQFDGEGFAIAEKTFSYSEFRSYSVDEDAAFSSITLLPLRRFAPAITLYYAPQNEEEIVNLLSQHLPYELHKSDFIDQFMKRIRF